MKKLLYAAPLVLALALAGCGETTVEDVTDKDKTEAKADSKEKKEEKAEDKVYAVGDTVKVNGVEITINSAKLRDADEYVDASNGKVLHLEVTAKNTKDESVYVDSNEFNVYENDEGREFYFGTSSKMPISGDINKGKVLKGFIEYDVSDGGKYELIYQPTFSLDNKEVKWDIEAK